MKATVNPDVLLKELKKISSVIKKSTIIPILECVLLKFEKNKLRITGTDLETTYITTIECNCSKPFSFPIEYTNIVEVCSSVSAPIEIDVDGKKCLITSGKSKFNFTLSATVEEYPLVPEDEFDTIIDVDGDFFFNLNNANSFRSKEDLKVNLNMAAIDIQKTGISLVGTDANYLFHKQIKNKNKKELNVMICETFILSCKHFQDSKLFIGEKFIKAEYDTEIVISRLSDNKFADYRRIMPTDAVYNFTVDKNELKSALRTANVAANLTSRQSVFNFSKKGVKIVSQDIDYGKDAEYEIEVPNTVEIEAICLNSGQLATILNHMEGDSIDFAFSAPNKTIFLKPTDDDSVLCLLQPLYLNN